MIIYQSPITKISWEELELLSLKVAEIESLLQTITEVGTCENQTGCLVSATERLANWLQADVLALIAAYRRQHPVVKNTYHHDEQGGDV